MGTSSEAELQDQGSEAGNAVTAETEPNRTGVWFRSMVPDCLNCRSGDDTADDGHMIVPSMGQAI